MGSLVLAGALLMVFAGIFALLFRKRRSNEGPVEPPARLDDYRRNKKSKDDDLDDDLF